MRTHIAGLATCAALALCACSGGDPDEPIEGALGMLGGLEEAEGVSFTFVDIEGLRAATGHAEDPGGIDEEARGWAEEVPFVAASVAASLPPSAGYFALESGEASWALHGTGPELPRFGIVHGADEAMRERAVEELEAQGWRIEDGRYTAPEGAEPAAQAMNVEVRERSVVAVSGPSEEAIDPSFIQEDADASALERPDVEAILPCLEGAPLVFATTWDALPEGVGAAAVAAAVDEDGRASAWSCIVGRENPESIVDTLIPTEPESVTVGESSMAGAVLRTELEVDYAEETGLPDEAHLVLRSRESIWPLF